MVAIRHCLERIALPRRERPVTFSMPKIETVSDAARGIAEVPQQAFDGTLTPGEDAQLTGLVEGCRRTIETAALEERLAKVEAALGKQL